MGMSQEVLRAIVRRQLSNELPREFPRPSFEPYLAAIIEPVYFTAGSTTASGGAAKCHAPADGGGYVFSRTPSRGRRRGGVRG